jgi:hypothetical protein
MQFNLDRFVRRVSLVLYRPWVLALVIVGALFLWKDGFPERNANGGWGINTAVDIALAYGIALVLAHIVCHFFSSTHFCTDSELRQEILNCVADSKDWLVIVSPYLDPGNVVAEAVLKAQGQGVDVKLYTHTKQVHDPTARAAIGRLGARGVKVFHHPNLHAKLCINERHVVVSSLNLVAGSFVDSYEAGISTNARGVHSEARKYIEKSIAQSDLCTRVEELELSPPHGFCIRTGVKIKFDPRKPVEYGEYRRAGGDERGKFCHACGQAASTSVGQPFCRDHEGAYS